MIQLARVSGFSPIIAIASRIHEEYLKSLGATHVINRHSERDDLKKAITGTTTAPIEIAYDAVSFPETQQVAFEILAPNGIGSPHHSANNALCQGLWSVLEDWLHRGVIKVTVLSD